MSTTPAELLRELDAKATKGPWEYTPDCDNGKEEYWGFWHSIGPVSMPGKESRPDTALLLTLRNALPLLAAYASAADALRAALTADGACLPLVSGDEYMERLKAYDAARDALVRAMQEGK